MAGGKWNQFLANYWRLILVVIGALLLAVVVMQNQENVSLQLLFMTVDLPTPILILLVFATGTIFGIVAGHRFRLGRRS